MADQWNKRQKDQGRLQPGLLLLSVNGEEDHEEIMSLIFQLSHHYGMVGFGGWWKIYVEIGVILVSEFMQPFTHTIRSWTPPDG